MHEGVPDGVPPADNEVGWRMALAKVAVLVEEARTIVRDGGRG